MLRKNAISKLRASELAPKGEPEAVQEPKQVISRRQRLHTVKITRDRGKRSERLSDDDGKGSAIAPKQRIKEKLEKSEPDHRTKVKRKSASGNERASTERRRLLKKRQSWNENVANNAADTSLNTRQNLRRCTAKPAFFDNHRRRIREQVIGLTC